MMDSHGTVIATPRPARLASAFGFRPPLVLASLAVFGIAFHIGPAIAQTGSDLRVSTSADAHLGTTMASTSKGFFIEVNVVSDAERFDEVKQSLGTETLLGGKVRWSRLERLSAADLLKANLVPELKVRCFVDLSRSDRATLYFADRTSRRFLFRELPIANDLDALERETLAQMMEFSISALLDESTAALSRDEAVALLRPLAADSAEPEAATPEIRSPPPERRWQPGARISGRFAVAEDSPQLGPALVPGIAVAAMFSRTASQQLGLQLVASQQLSRRMRSAFAGVELSGLDLRVEGLALFPFATRNDPMEKPGIGLALGAGIQRLDITALEGSDGETLQLLEPRSATMPFLSAGLRVHHGFGPGLVMAVGGTLDLALRTLSCDVERNAERHAIVSTRQLRPSLFIELSWEGKWQIASNSEDRDSDEK
ncbi:MAG: hypothetical protein QM784_18460 [Polyangiaceae bacterium]